MANTAKYTIHIPTHDNVGNRLRDLATAAHQHLFQNAGVEGSYIERGKDGNWRDDPQETLDHLVTFTEDSPEVESHVKQTAAHVADVANQWGVTVTKEGKDGPNLWVIDNPNYQEGQPAHPVAIDQGVGELISALQPEASRRSPKASGGDLVAYLEETSVRLAQALRGA